MSRLANRLLAAFALVVTDRRWAAPLSAMALGFGLFIGVAVGPNAAGTLAGAPPLVEVVGGGGDDAADEAETASSPLEPAGESLGGATAGGASASLVAPAPAPSEPLPEAAPIPPEPTASEPQPAPEAQPPAGEPAAEEEESTELKGVVVHANSAAGSYALAIAGGELVPVHTRTLPKAGTKVEIAARRLANGTFAELGERRRKGSTRRVLFDGTVTYVRPDPAAPAYTVSGRGASILVHVDPTPDGALPLLPVLGARVTVTAAVEASPAPETSTPILSQVQLEVEPGEPTLYIDLAGIAAAPAAGQLAISADDTRESGQDLIIAVPPGIDVSALEPGDSYLATATVNPDGSLTLAGLASDEHRRGADDPSLALGDLKRS